MHKSEEVSQSTRLRKEGLKLRSEMQSNVGKMKKTGKATIIFSKALFFAFMTVNLILLEMRKEHFTIIIITILLLKLPPVHCEN